MRRVLSIVRPLLFLKIQPSRAAKKAKTDTSPQSDDLINIFKDRKDPEIKDIDEYPIWLLQLGLPILDPKNAVLAMRSGDEAFSPEAHDVNHLGRSMRRMRIIEQNQQKHMESKKTTEFEYTGNVNLENKVKSREEELALAEKERSAAQEAVEDDEDDEEGGKKVRIVVDREKERKEEEDFKAKLSSKKTK